LTQPPEMLGLVLAGGRSRRLGRDKAALEVQGQGLLERTVNLLKPFVKEVFVSAVADQADDRVRQPFHLLFDRQPDLGPAGGLLAAHEHRPDVAWLVLACDLPLMDEAAVGRLIGSRDARKDATSYRSVDGGAPEPLCAIYEPDTLARFDQQVGAGGNLSPRDFLANADVEYVEPDRDRVLLNLNTPDDLSRIQNDGDAGRLETQENDWNENG
jgi:molybdopterin-guanine dinucleotide biosynthesis protein A